MPINADFNLLAELTHEQFAISRRIELMMSRYQTRPIFGIVENKLLAHSLLHSVPTLVSNSLERALVHRAATCDT